METPLPLPPELLEGDYPFWPERWSPPPSLVEPGPSATPEGTETRASGARPESLPATAAAPAAPAGTATSPPAPPIPPHPFSPPPAASHGPTHAPAPTPAPIVVHTSQQPIALWLDPRDPFSLVAHWQTDPHALSRWMPALDPNRLRLRVHAHHREGLMMTEQLVGVSTRYRSVPVLYAATPYVAELGYVDAEGLWRSLAVSEPASTPPDAARSDWAHRRHRYEELEPETSTRPTASELRLTAPHFPNPGLPDFKPASEQATAVDAKPMPSPVEATYLASLVWEPEPPRLSAGHSAELAEAGGRWVSIPQVVLHPSPLGPSSPAPTRARPPGELDSLPSSPTTGRPAPAPGDFWFKVNAELIVYGSTEPDASVAVAGRPIRLRDDGSFSFRFSLPDGHYSLPAIAVKADGSDTRSAHLEFSRTTRYSGEVGLHPQDPALQPPVAASLS